MILKKYLNRDVSLVRAIDPYDTLIGTHSFTYDFNPDPIWQAMQLRLQEDGKLSKRRNLQKSRY